MTKQTTGTAVDTHGVSQLCVWREPPLAYCTVALEAFQLDGESLTPAALAKAVAAAVSSDELVLLVTHTSSERTFDFQHFIPTPQRQKSAASVKEVGAVGRHPRAVAAGLPQKAHHLLAAPADGWEQESWSVSLVRRRHGKTMMVFASSAVPITISSSGAVDVVLLATRGAQTSTAAAGRTTTAAAAAGPKAVVASVSLRRVIVSPSAPPRESNGVHQSIAPHQNKTKTMPPPRRTRPMSAALTISSHCEDDGPLDGTGQPHDLQRSRVAVEAVAARLTNVAATFACNSEWAAVAVSPHVAINDDGALVVRLDAFVDGIEAPAGAVVSCALRVTIDGVPVMAATASRALTRDAAVLPMVVSSELTDALAAMEREQGVILGATADLAVAPSDAVLAPAATTPSWSLYHARSWWLMRHRLESSERDDEVAGLEPGVVQYLLHLEAATVLARRTWASCVTLRQDVASFATSDSAATSADAMATTPDLGLVPDERIQLWAAATLLAAVERAMPVARALAFASSSWKALHESVWMACAVWAFAWCMSGLAPDTLQANALVAGFFTVLGFASLSRAVPKTTPASGTTMSNFMVVEYDARAAGEHADLGSASSAAVVFAAAALLRSIAESCVHFLPPDWASVAHRDGGNTALAGTAHVAVRIAGCAAFLLATPFTAFTLLALPAFLVGPSPLWALWCQFAAASHRSTAAAAADARGDVPVFA